MAARTRKIRHDDQTRAKIKASQLINRLQNYVFGEVELEGGQVTAALGLLRKTLPDLSQAQHTGEGGGPIQVAQVTRLIVDAEPEDTDR